MKGRTLHAKALIGTACKVTTLHASVLKVVGTAQQAESQ